MFNSCHHNFVVQHVGDCVRAVSGFWMLRVLVLLYLLDEDRSLAVKINGRDVESEAVSCLGLPDLLSLVPGVVAAVLVLLDYRLDLALELCACAVHV